MHGGGGAGAGAGGAGAAATAGAAGGGGGTIFDVETLAKPLSGRTQTGA
jgi:hypothetical protein